MKIRHIVSITFGSITLLLVYLAVHLGVFKAVDFSEKTSEAHLLLSLEHIGPYHKIVPLIQEVENWVRKEGGQQCKKTFGLFLDYPKTTDQERLRAQVGCLLEGPLATVPPENMKILEIAPRAVIAAEFSGSPAIGPYKVYMKIETLLKEKGLSLDGPAMEIYEVINQKEMNTSYEFPIKNKF